LNELEEEPWVVFSYLIKILKEMKEPFISSSAYYSLRSLETTDQKEKLEEIKDNVGGLYLVAFNTLFFLLRFF